MTSQWWSDDELFAALEDALREARDAPRHFTDTGKAAFAWRTVDAELAAIVYDSAADSQQLTGATTRAERAALRELTFSTAHLKIHLQVTDQALHGQIVPPQRCDVEVHMANASPHLIRTDEDGWFTVRPIPIGSFRLLCRSVGTTALTDWLAV